MGKQQSSGSRRNRKTGSSSKNKKIEDNKNNTRNEQHRPSLDEKHELTLVGHYTSFKRSLDDCSLELIQDAYRQQGDMYKNFDLQASREKMEDFLLKTTYLDFPIAATYVKAAARELKQMGGVKLISIATKGKKNTESFIYTKGFTDLGGPEFLMQNVHRSVFNWVSNMLNDMYTSRKDGVIYKENQTISIGKVVFKFQKPSESDALVLKATRMLDTLSYYGLNGFDVLYIIPIAVQKIDEAISAFQVLFPDDKIDSDTTDELKEISMKGFRRGSVLVGRGEDVPGFVRVDSRELRMCGFCTATDQELGEDGCLKNCIGCKTALYCSKSCQKKHWKKHKTQCASWQELKKKKDKQEKDDEACETISSFLHQYSKEIDWDGYQPEKKERMKGEEGQKEHIRDAIKTAKEVRKFFAESFATSM